MLLTTVHPLNHSELYNSLDYLHTLYTKNTLIHGVCSVGLPDLSGLVIVNPNPMRRTFCIVNLILHGTPQIHSDVSIPPINWRVYQPFATRDASDANAPLVRLRSLTNYDLCDHYNTINTL